MKTTINSKLYGKIDFFCSAVGKYVYVNLNSKPGTLGNQICVGGHLTGSTISYYGDEMDFGKFCRNWWNNYLRNQRNI